MTVSPVRLLLVLITSFLCSIGYGQSLKAYRTVKVLSGQSIDIPAESIGYPDFIRRPETGSVSKFKFGYEEVYRIRYTAPHSFVGVDTVIYKTSRKVFGIAKPFFEGFVVEASPVIAQADYFAADLHAGSVNLAVLQNDLSVDGNLLISKLSYVSNGSASISGDGRSIRFTPSSTGYAKISYTVCSGGKCSAALVVVRVDDHNVLPKPDTLYYRIMRDEKATIITGPGFKPPSNTYFSGELVRTESQIFEFTPPLGYSGTEVLKFTNLIGGVQFTQVVTIAVEDPFIENGWNVEDHIYTEVGNSVIFSISDNDLGGNINSVNTNGLKGSLTSLGTGIYRYTPQSGFRGQTKFTYESCGEGRCDETTVYVTVHNYEPLYDEVKVYTTANQELKLDYRVPIDDYNFTLLRSATNGSVLISADGKSITYRPGDNFVGMDVFALAYCVGLSGECKDVLVDVNVQDVSVSGGCEGCVWPGDHNDNGQVDIQDAVVLATNIGYSGPARSGSTSSLDWYPQEAQDWPVALSFGTPNLKYVDGNGDGLISTKDFGPLNMHYMKAHSIVPSPPLGYDAVPLQLDVLTPVVQAGDWAVIEVSLGSSAYPVDDLLGMNFTLEIGSRFVDSSSVQFTLAEDGIFNPTNSVIAFAKSPKDGIIDVGIGKVDKEPIHGHGVVGQIKFIVEEDLNGFRSLDELFRKKLVGKRIGILGSKDLYALEDTEVYVTIRRDQLTTDDIQIYPNPASDWVTLPSNVRSGNLVNAYGQLVKDLSSADLQMDVSNLPSGTYILELLLDNDKKIRKRLEIVR